MSARKPKCLVCPESPVGRGNGGRYCRRHKVEIGEIRRLMTALFPYRRADAKREKKACPVRLPRVYSAEGRA